LPLSSIRTRSVLEVVNASRLADGVNIPFTPKEPDVIAKLGASAAPAAVATAFPVIVTPVADVSIFFAVSK